MLTEAFGSVSPVALSMTTPLSIPLLCAKAVEPKAKKTNMNMLLKFIL
jgi:hypothetical protein